MTMLENNVAGLTTANPAKSFCLDSARSSPISFPGTMSSVRTSLLPLLPSLFSSESSNVDETNPASDSSSFCDYSNFFAEEQWQKAYDVLESNPRLMKASILCMALKRRAPLHLIRLMLKLDPNAASIPREGPSPLQIAVQSSCSLEVIKELLKHCPFALIATNPGSHIDPLSYAKRFRSEESDLIQLLSLPISHWIKPEVSPTITAGQYSYMPRKDLKQTANTDEEQSTPLFSSYSCGSADTTVSTSVEMTAAHGCSKMKKAHHSLSSMDYTELNNIKLICLSVLKGHKRLAKDMHFVQKQLLKIVGMSTEDTIPLQSEVVHKLDQHSKALMAQLQEEQHRATRTQLLALEMKEQAIQAQLHKSESRLVEHVQKQTDALTSNLEQRVESAIRAIRNRFQQFTDRLDFAETHVRELFDSTNAMRAFIELAKSSQNQQTFKSKKMKHKKGCRRIEPDVISPRTASTAPLTPSDSTFFHDFPVLNSNRVANHGYKVDDELPLPIMFATPFCSFPDDDVRSLLTEETIVERAGHHHRRSRRAVMIIGKRWLSVFCNRQ